MNHYFTCFLTILCFCLLGSQATAQVYVKSDATGANDGSSWGNAYDNLQTAINDNPGQTLWVAAGTWLPEDLTESNTPTFKIA